MAVACWGSAAGSSAEGHDEHQEWDGGTEGEGDWSRRKPEDLTGRARSLEGVSRRGSAPLGVQGQ